MDYDEPDYRQYSLGGTYECMRRRRRKLSTSFAIVKRALSLQETPERTADVGRQIGHVLADAME
jgi:hypothetical protein